MKTNLTITSTIEYGGIFATSMWTEVHRLNSNENPSTAINSLYDPIYHRRVTRVGPILGTNLQYNVQNPIWVGNTPFTVLPTDYIVVYCQYSTLNSPFPISGGNGTNFTEFCMASLSVEGATLNNGSSTTCGAATSVFNSTVFSVGASDYIKMANLASGTQ